MKVCVLSASNSRLTNVTENGQDCKMNHYRHFTPQTRPSDLNTSRDEHTIASKRRSTLERAPSLVDNCGRDVALLVLEKVHAPPRETRPHSRADIPPATTKDSRGQNETHPGPGPRHFSRQSAPPSTRAAQVRSCDAAQSNRAREASPYRPPTCRSQL
jgi:hypothetical protein